MAITDIPPADAPPWLVFASSTCVAIGVFFWQVAYVLMVKRSLATNATPVPLLPLGLNLAWEVVWAIYISETAIERIAFGGWLLLDIPVLYATLRSARTSFAGQPLLARHAGTVLFATFAVSLVAYAYFAVWWLEDPDRGYGIKFGKQWKGNEGRDMTELTYWTAGFAQTAFSVGALAMLVQRGHSGGQSLAIWFCRFLGTQIGLPISTLVLWWWWPEPNGYVLDPLSIIMIATSLFCDLAYPFVLVYVQKTERILPDGTVVSGLEAEEALTAKTKTV